MANVEHVRDSDCTIDPETLCCDVCGVDHSDECLDCGGPRVSSCVVRCAVAAGMLARGRKYMTTLEQMEALRDAFTILKTARYATATGPESIYGKLRRACESIDRQIAQLLSA